MHIRKMTVTDIPEIHKIGTTVEGFRVSNDDIFWSQEQLEKWIENDQDVLLVAEENDQIAGFVTSTLHLPTGKATVENHFVAPASRQEGVGAALLEQLLLHLRAKGATYVCFLVRAENRQENDYYARRGFKPGFNFTWFGKHL